MFDEIFCLHQFLIIPAKPEFVLDCFHINGFLNCICAVWLFLRFIINWNKIYRFLNCFPSLCLRRFISTSCWNAHIQVSKKITLHCNWMKALALCPQLFTFMKIVHFRILWVESLVYSFATSVQKISYCRSKLTGHYLHSNETEKIAPKFFKEIFPGTSAYIGKKANSKRKKNHV